MIEGIAYALKEGLEGIEKSQKHKVKELRISGGGSQSDAICQITADIFNLPVSRVQTYETTSLGAALATFVAIKEFKDVNEATESMVHKSTTFYPNKSASEVYEELYRHVYIRMFPRLKRIYRYINKFTKRY
jgi:sugar (pentulose or hexulose) kinase